MGEALIPTSRGAGIYLFGSLVYMLKSTIERSTNAVIGAALRFWHAIPPDEFMMVVLHLAC
jgi:hypothetical protein